MLETEILNSRQINQNAEDFNKIINKLCNIYVVLYKFINNIYNINI